MSWGEDGEDFKPAKQFKDDDGLKKFASSTWWDKPKTAKPIKPFGPVINSPVSPIPLGAKLGPGPKWKTGDGYDIKGGDHVVHVQKKLDESGASKNFEIVLPEPNELQLDYDEKVLPEQFWKGMDLLTQAYCALQEGLPYVVTESCSGNRHVTISLPCQIDPVTRVAWQAVFGSDLMREGLSLMSITRGLKNPTLLIERKGGAVVERGFAVHRERAAVGRMFRPPHGGTNDRDSNQG
jgi:hypothetical protein